MVNKKKTQDREFPEDIACDIASDENVRQLQSALLQIRVSNLRNFEYKPGNWSLYLGYHKFVAQCIQQRLTDEHKICIRVLQYT